MNIVDQQRMPEQRWELARRRIEFPFVASEATVLLITNQLHRLERLEAPVGPLAFVPLAFIWVAALTVEFLPVAYPVSASLFTWKNKMRSTLPSLLTCLSIMISLSSTRVEAQSRDIWHRNLDSARKLAREANRPLMVVFRCER